MIEKSFFGIEKRLIFFDENKLENPEVNKINL
jgi:hypothetical protein